MAFEGLGLTRLRVEGVGSSSIYFSRFWGFGYWGSPLYPKIWGSVSQSVQTSRKKLVASDVMRISLISLKDLAASPNSCSPLRIVHRIRTVSSGGIHHDIE